MSEVTLAELESQVRELRQRLDRVEAKIDWMWPLAGRLHSHGATADESKLRHNALRDRS